MALPDRRPSALYSAAFYGEIDDELGPDRVGFDIFYPNPVLNLALSEFQKDPEQTVIRMTELAEALIAYPNVPIKMTVNTGGKAATQLDLGDVLKTFRQKIEAGYKYEGEDFEACLHLAQANVASFLGTLSAPLDTLCAMQQSGSLTDFGISMPKETYNDIDSLRPILNTLTAYRLKATAKQMISNR